MNTFSAVPNGGEWEGAGRSATGLMSCGEKGFGQQGDLFRDLGAFAHAADRCGAMPQAAAQIDCLKQTSESGGRFKLIVQDSALHPN